MVFDSIKNTNGRRPGDFKHWKKNFKKIFAQVKKENRASQSEEKEKTDPFAEIKARLKRR